MQIRTFATPTRSTNFTAILRKLYVSGTERALDTITHQDPMEFQKAKRLPYFKALYGICSIERRGCSFGASGTARQMAGINSVISTNLTARALELHSLLQLEDILQNSGMQLVKVTLLTPSFVQWVSSERLLGSLPCNAVQQQHEGH